LRKIMRRSSITILLIAAVIIGLVGIAYFTGTISFGNRAEDLQTDTDADAGLQTVSGTTQSPLTTFEEALDQLSQRLQATPSSSNFTLHYIRGTDLDVSGQAAHWLFGVGYDNQSVLMYYDNPGWRSVSWEGALPEKEIGEGSFVSLAKFINRNAGILYASDPQREGLIRRMDLMNGKYTITMERQGAQQTFVFDAASGELIP
jgi:hypothetical protein